MSRKIRIVFGLCLAIAILGTALAVGAFLRSSRGDVLASAAPRLARQVAAQSIAHVHLTCEVRFTDPDTALLDATCRISGSTERGNLTLLLNDGLNVESLREGDTDLRSKRRAEVLEIDLPRNGPFTIELAYRGGLESTLLAQPGVGDRHLVAPMEVFWYPMDLSSTPTFRGSVSAAPDLEVVLGGIEIRHVESDDTSTIMWNKDDPWRGSSLFVGPASSQSFIFGMDACSVYGPVGASERGLHDTLYAAGRIYNVLQALLGDDGRDGVVVVAVPDGIIRAPYAAGDSLVLAPVSTLSTPSATLAPLIARNWWGGVVAAPWFTSRPDGDAWVREGLPVYAGRVALKRLEHEDSWLNRALEDGPSLRVPVPLRTVGVLEASRVPVSPALHGFIASILAAYVGDGPMVSAMGEVLREHRHGTVTVGRFMDALSQAAETDLREFTRVWFDRTGHLDYAVAGVDESEGHARIRIENRGDIPAFARLPLLVETAHGATIHLVDPGARGGEVTVPIEDWVVRVILDPAWLTADTDRANNVYPRQWRLAHADVNATGDLGLTLSESLRLRRDDRARVFLWRDEDEGLVECSGDVHLREPARWTPDGAIEAPLTDGGTLTYPGDHEPGGGKIDAHQASEHVLGAVRWPNPSGGLYAEIDELGHCRIVNADGTERSRVRLHAPAREIDWRDDEYFIVVMSQPVAGLETHYVGWPEFAGVRASTGRVAHTYPSLARRLRSQLQQIR